MYAVWVIVAMNRSATISVDYVALLNEKAAAVPEEERAWPLYREAGIALRLNPMPSTIFFDEEIEEPSWPDQEGWNHFDVWLGIHKDTIETLYKATTKKGYGYVLSGQVSETDQELRPAQYESQQTEEPRDGFTMSVLLPQLAPLRQMALLLAIDAKAAAVAGDSSRCLNDIESMLQIGTHVREHPLLISDLVSQSIYSMTFATIGQIVEHEPRLFSTEQFASLEDTLAMLEDYFIIRLEGERYFLLDLLQRMYTDDGNGDGNIIPAQATRLLEFTETITSESSSGTLLPTLLAPVADLIYASRKEMYDEYNKRLDFAEDRIGIPLYELKQMKNVWATPWEQRRSTYLDPYCLVDLLAPALQRAAMIGEFTRAKRDATLAVLYAVQFHNESGQWPTDLTNAGVIDAWSGKPLLIIEIDGSPIIYSVGFDQEDDGGQWDKTASGWAGNSDGDWIIWPRPE